MRALLAVLLVTVALAGCLDDDATDDGDGLTMVEPWALDCSLAAFNDAAYGQGCARRASTTPGSKAETWIAVNPTDPRNVVVGAKDMNPEMSNRCVWTGYAATHDGGETWTEFTIGGRFADRRPPEPWFGYACNTDPMFTFGPDGTLHAVLDLYGLGASPQSFLAVHARMLLVSSDDGGLTWPRSAVLVEGDGVVDAPDYPRIAVSPTTGTVVASFINFLSSGVCFIGASEDNGATAREPVRIPVDPASSGCQVLAAAPDGSLVAGGIAGSEFWFVRSEDDGLTWTAPEVAFPYDQVGQFEENEFPVSGYAELAFDATGGPHHGRLYFSTAADAAGRGADVFVRWSDDEGVTWSEPVRVNDDAGDHDQWLSNVAVAGDGSVHVIFMDKRHDAPNRLVDVTHAVSVDGGANWTNARVTTASFEGERGDHQNGGPFLGDYNGIAAAADAVWLGFPEAATTEDPVMGVAVARLARR